MKQSLVILTALFLLATLASYSQTTIHYTYDAAGNRTERSITVGGGSKGFSSINEKSEKPEEIKDETFSPLSVKIYPNPTRGLLTVEVPENPDISFETQLKVTDLNGRIIFHKKDVPVRTKISLEAQPNGLYILYIIQDKVVSKWKVIKR